MEDKIYYVYVYLNQTKPGKWIYKNIEFKYQPFYVGKGKNSRDKAHLFPSQLKRRNRKNSIIKSIFKKTGESPIHYRIFENITNEESIEIECDFIKTFGKLSLNNGILANDTDGGEGGGKISNSCKKNRINKRKNVYQYDLNGCFIKKWNSLFSLEEEFQNFSNIPTAIKRDGTYMGYIWSYKYLPKMIPKIKYQMPIKHVKIKQIDKESDKVLNIFENALEIETKLKLRSGARNKIYDCLNKKLKTAYGYKWQKQE